MLKKYFVLMVKRKLSILCNQLYKNPRVLKSIRKIDELSDQLYQALDEQNKAKLDALCNAYDTLLDLTPKHYYKHGFKEGLNLKTDILKGGF